MFVLRQVYESQGFGKIPVIVGIVVVGLIVVAAYLIISRKRDK